MEEHNRAAAKKAAKFIRKKFPGAEALPHDNQVMALMREQHAGKLAEELAGHLRAWEDGIAKDRPGNLMLKQSQDAAGEGKRVRMTIQEIGTESGFRRFLIFFHSR